MSVRPATLVWFHENYPDVHTPVYASKIYKPEEAWHKQKTWWFELSLKEMKPSGFTSVNLLCQIDPNGHSFFYLKVPVIYLMKNLAKLYIRDDKISLYLSPVKYKWFVEERGTGKVEFRQFLVNK